MTIASSRDALAIALESYYESLASDQFIAVQSFAESIAAEAEEESTSTDPLFFVFYWDIDDLINEISMVTHYKGKNIRSQEKEAMPRLDELTLTSDDLEMLMRLLKNASKDVYKSLAPYGKDIAGGYLFNQGDLPGEYDDEVVYDKGDLFYVVDQLYYTLQDETPAGTDPEDTDYFLAVGEHYNTYHKIIYVITYDSNMDASMIDVLDKDIEDAIIKYVLYEWYKVIQEVGMAAFSKEEYEDAITKVNVSAWYRKSLIRRRSEML